ncbi:MAG: LysR family transcriptional regulator [Paracoccus sp. (in: a-proteobacteria)]|nr:LysR family transcriptional regulator [Paracoccus sp. (in: a-proteobacteria)]
MEQIQTLRAFLAVADSGGFTAAGKALGLSNKLVGKYVAALEARLGQPLFYRSTRAVSLTAAGEDYQPHARRILAAWDEAETAFATRDGSLSGRLRISCGTTLGALFVADACQQFLETHPAMRVDLHLSDGLTDLAAGGFDLALRIGVPRDSSLRMRRIGQTMPRIAASPDYLARHGRPDHPGDLASHHAILDLNEDSPGRWPFHGPDGEALSVLVPGALAVNSASVTITMAIQGKGLVRAPDIFLAPALASGRLVLLLPDYTSPGLPIHILSHPTGFRQEKIAAFGQFLRRHLARVMTG